MRVIFAVPLEVIGHVTLGEAGGFDHDRELARGFLDRDDVADLDLIGGDVDAAAVDLDVTVVDELARGEHGRDELGAIDHRVEAALELADQIGGRVALHAERFDVIGVELALRDVPVIALDLLLRGRPQMFSPMRRSILYLACARFVIAVPLKGDGQGTRPPLRRTRGFDNDRLCAEQGGSATGASNAERAPVPKGASSAVGPSRPGRPSQT